MSDTQLAADQAAYSALEKEFGDAPGTTEQTVTQDEPKAEAPAAEVKPAEEQPKPPVPYEELERRHKNVNAALAEARAETRAYRERVAQFEQVLQAIKQKQSQPQEPPADEFEDPIVRELRTVKEQAAQLAEQQRILQAERAEQERAAQIGRHVSYHEAEFAKQAPDYYDAVGHLRQSRADELALMMPDDDPNVVYQARKSGFATPAEFRDEIIRREAMSLAQRAIESGQSPAAVFYNLAKHRGFSRPAPAALKEAPAQIEAPKQQRIEQIRKGQDAPPSLSTGATKSSANAEGFPSLEELADMYVSDPSKAEKTFQKMRSAGLLG